jgi:hypothetical protein
MSVNPPRQYEASATVRVGELLAQAGIPARYGGHEINKMKTVTG